jgi:hypothetical protein
MKNFTEQRMEYRVLSTKFSTLCLSNWFVTW